MMVSSEECEQNAIEALLCLLDNGLLSFKSDSVVELHSFARGHPNTLDWSWETAALEVHILIADSDGISFEVAE